MWNIISSALRRGVVTASLGELLKDAPAGALGRPQLFADRCTVDGACQDVCPSGAISIEAHPPNVEDVTTYTFTLDYGACVFCGRCAEVCPASALQMTSDYALSTLSRDDLVLHQAIAKSAKRVIT